MTAPSFVNDGGITGVVFPSSPRSPALPGSRVNGNLLLAYLQLKNVQDIITVSGTGWQPLVSMNNGAGGNACSICIAGRIVDGAESAPVFSWGGGGFAAHEMCFQWTGNYNTLDCIGAISTNFTSGGSSLVLPSINTTFNDSDVIAWFFTNTNNPGNPSGYTQRHNFFDGFCGDIESNQTFASTGATGTATSAFGAADESCGVLMEITSTFVPPVTPVRGAVIGPGI